ncbi:MAG: M23 family metallopeptidase [Pseudomonadota bacterium]
MSSASIREPASFGKRKEPHTIVVTRNGKSRQFTISPAMFSVLAGTLFMFLFGYFGATAYLILRDDLISASNNRQARMQHAYEDRIAALRSKLDRVTSRQLLDQRSIEIQVQELMARQERIGGRSGRMNSLMEKARLRGIDGGVITGKLPVPQENPVKTGVTDEQDQITTGSVKPVFGNSAAAGSKLSLTAESSTNAYLQAGNGDAPEKIFANVSEAIGVIDANQRREIDFMRITAAKRATKIESVLSSIGISSKKNTGENSDIGGPFVTLDASAEFETHLDALEHSLKMYDSVATVAKTVPLGTPVVNAKISSRYGSRIDPFNGRLAMHSGIDFKAKRGTPVLATGDGVVIKAGRKGGYGKVVEIKHRNGYTTRYAHLSRILVKTGQKVSKGQSVGKVGSTGRSTGPHLHYEVRRGKKPRNPAKYIQAGYEIRGLL